MTSWASQFSSGAQGESREEFWRNGFRTCPRCNNSNVISDVRPAGCRMSGDAYGTEEYTCQDCKWQTSFQYDEAAEVYYYETRFWSREPPKPTPIRPLDDALRAKFVRIFKMVGPRATASAMIDDGISASEIEAFVNEQVLNAEDLQKQQGCK